MRVGDLFPTRRELLRYGGMGLLGASAQGIWPLQMGAATNAKVTPRFLPAISSRKPLSAITFRKRRCILKPRSG